MNQHPKYGSRVNLRRSNSFQRKYSSARKIKKTYSICKCHFTMGGYYRDMRSGRYKRYTYNDKKMKRYCGKILRYYHGVLSTPGLYKRVVDYVNIVL